MANFDDLLETLKRVAAVLRDTDLPFLLGGGLAAWARGGPETEHDLDLMVKPENAEGVLDSLAAAGFRTEKPPEAWLYKAWDGDLLIDVIFDPMGGPIDDAMFERADELEVQAVTMKVMALEDVMVTKLLAMREHEDSGVAQHCDHVVAAVGMPVVVSEHRDDRLLDPLDDLGQRPGLLGLAVERQVAREQDQIGFTPDRGEGRRQALVVRAARMDVPGCRDLDHG